jgi:aminoglycoside phosphotransferase (APT) family kinase protein
VAAWLRARRPSLGRVGVRAAVPAAAGYSNEVVFLTLDGQGPEDLGPELVLRRAPSGATLFRTYDLGMQAAVQDAVRAAGVPVPAFALHEPDPSWLGAPFLLMPRVPGHVPGELAALDPWVARRAPADQRRLQAGFLDAVAAVHDTPWEGTALAGRLRGADGTLADEIDWWDELMEWSFDGAPPADLVDALRWCRDHRPHPEPPRSLLWGDVRLGNVVFGDDLAPRAVLDWEMASIGPAESDLAWCTALDEMGAHFVEATVPGFLDRDGVVARHAAALGRPLVAFRWFELFALCQAAALNLRRSALAAVRAGRPALVPARDAVLGYALAAIAEADRDPPWH